MKFYLLDDDRNVRRILKLIITERGLGEVCGASASAQEALEDFTYIKPDVVVVDLLMPEMDGITFVKLAREQMEDTAFVMLSQVSSKEMISQAYESGIEFYIQKPVNSVEVERVLNSVCQKLLMSRTITKVQDLFLSTSAEAHAAPVEKESTTRLRNILQKLGIIGELGSRDIMQLVDYLTEHEGALNHTTLTNLCAQLSPNPKSVEQRIRRAAQAGMVNLAHLGLEDYSNEVFTEYASTLYNFEQVRREMDFIRGKSDKHGNVKIKNFLNALVACCQD